MCDGERNARKCPLLDAMAKNRKGALKLFVL
jgi:hypothetical protein